ncbi:MAG TPA: CaiB/BaiF CoA-transferase family protein [Cytophagaceae bacterium]|jgi:crotonobetainyl-CoA:carnitine CoA-transferase CaiB-like acyl-CoA transferase
MTGPLSNITIIDFSQFLSGPSCTLRLADLGAEVIKIEKPVTGDICRQLYVSKVVLEGQSSLFHAINRNKKSFTADLKKELDLAAVKKLLVVADVMVHNFRPGVMERLGLDYSTVKEINHRIIYASISGYGNEGAWSGEPGQDLLVQAVSGLTWLSGAAFDGPVPMGVSVVDILAGTYLTQGILAALYRRTQKGCGGTVDVNMLESSIDYQFELFSTFLNDGGELPERSSVNPAHAYVSAPYGIYKTSDGYLAIAMAPVPKLGELLGCKQLLVYTEPANWFTLRDEIKTHLANHLKGNTTARWLESLEPADIWCAPVLNYEALRRENAYQQLDMEQEVCTSQGSIITTTRCPIRINGKKFKSPVGAPWLGEHNKSLKEKYHL